MTSTEDHNAISLFDKLEHNEKIKQSGNAISLEEEPRIWKMTKDYCGMTSEMTNDEIDRMWKMTKDYYLFGKLEFPIVEPKYVR
jgi:hypothetical protein